MRTDTFSATYSYVANSALVQDIVFKHTGFARMATSRQHDRLNRLSPIGSLSSATGPFTYAYGYNAANQRTSRTEADGSYWSYGYDGLGQLTSGKKRWSDNSYVPGQQFEYSFEDIGNITQSKAGGDAMGGSLRTTTYSDNYLNQITSRSVTNKFDVIGSAPSNAVVSVNGDTNVYRHGEYFQYLFTTNNSAAAVYPCITNMAVLNGVTNTFTPGNVFRAKDPESGISYDADGNETNDGWSLVG